jgi:hypothetical protein
VNIRPFALIVLSLAFVVARSPGDLSKKYGPPDAEGYRVTPDPTLIVTYGADQTLCELLVRPRSSATGAISSTVVDRLLRELVPQSARQGTPLTWEERMGCLANRNADYRNLRITRTSNECLADRDKTVLSLTVKWKTATMT